MGEPVRCTSVVWKTTGRVLELRPGLEPHNVFEGHSKTLGKSHSNRDDISVLYASRFPDGVEAGPEYKLIDKLLRRIWGSWKSLTGRSTSMAHIGPGSWSRGPR